MSRRIQALVSVSLCTCVLLLAQSIRNVHADRDARQDQETCHLRELDLCLASLSVLTQNSNAHPITNSEVNRQCKILMETETCFNNYTSRCLNENQSKFFSMVADGGLDTIRELCKPQSKIRDNYLKHGDCINNQHKGQRVCVRDFQASLDKVPDIDWQDRLKLSCCSFNRLNACVRDLIEPKCGAEAYEMTKMFIRTTFSRLPSLSCSKYEHNGKACAALLPPAGTPPKGSKSHSVMSRLLSTYTGGN